MRDSEDLRSLKIALGAYVVVFGLKLTAYFLTGVLALLAEAFHTLSDMLVTGLLILAAYYSRKAADETHMFGYGRAQYVAALTAATLFISFTSYKLYEESVPRLLQPSSGEFRNLSLALGVLIASMIIAAIPLLNLLRLKSRGPAAKAQFLESINDELGLVAALVGTIFVLWRQPIADPIASVVVATIIAFNGVRLFAENLSFLLGRSPGVEYLARIEGLARSVPGVLGVHDLRAEYVGPETVHAGMHIEVSSRLTVEEAERIRMQVDEKIHHGASTGFCVIQVEPAVRGGPPMASAHEPTSR